MVDASDDDIRRRNAVADYRKKLLQRKKLESRLRTLKESLKTSKKEFTKTEDDLKSLQSVGLIIGEVDNEHLRESLKTSKKEFTKTEDDLKSLQSVGQIIWEVDNERFLVKASSGPSYVVGCGSKVDKEKLTVGTRVVLDMTTLTIMRALPREVDPVVHNMLHEDPGNVSYSAVGGLSDKIRQLREYIELSLMIPGLFRVGIKPRKGVLLYDPRATGKTLLARAIARNIYAIFLKPCISFLDEIDAIGGRRFSETTSADREIQRTLMELLYGLDGFNELGKHKKNITRRILIWFAFVNLIAAWAREVRKRVNQFE